MIESDDPSWCSYSNTLVQFASHNFVIDLRVRLHIAQIRQIQALGLGLTFSVLTAYNPRGRVVTASENEQRHQRLENLLHTSGWSYLASDGMDPEAQHVERGFAISLSIKDAEALAIQFEQSAFFWFDGDSFWIQPALVRAHPTKLPLAT